MVHIQKEKKLQFYPSAQDPGPKQMTVGGSSDLTCVQRGLPSAHLTLGCQGDPLGGGQLIAAECFPLKF